MKTAFVIDDNLSYQKIISAHLNQLGFEVKSFLSAKECLSHLKDAPHLILLNQHLGDNELGLDYIKEIKEKSNEAPIVFLSADNDVYTVTKALKMGAFDYIEKNGSALVRLRTAIDNIPDYLKKGRRQKMMRIAGVSAAIVIAIGAALFFLFR
ncbi:MAG: response regulator [Cytophagales bacterium]|jgi:DNA-binding NtrC family response regulator|nr:response regulator [Cytophagales bacterium]MCE2895772.1 response regulator [Flammeovirgaceae bacterium]MCA6369630.1 response regulator [Cytophagales bacterium]MCA6372476.1 response regulator [Cytophagales bacterium]MCA6378033.1 response regulator [Cytophagales bacterium]